MTTKRITKKKAQELWDNLRNTMLNTEKILLEIIQTEAWKPLGYESFLHAWEAELSGVKLGSEAMKAAVVEAMFKEGLTDDEVDGATLGTGIGPRTIKRVKKEMETPGKKVTGRPVVTRKPRSEDQTVHVKLDPVTYANYKAACAALDLDFQEEARRAIESHFHTLEVHANRFARSA